MRPMEAGAGGVMAAQVRSARQAEEVVRWAKFFSRRDCGGVNGGGVDGRYGTMPPAEYFNKANAETFVAIQIEHVERWKTLRKSRRFKAWTCSSSARPSGPIHGPDRLGTIRSYGQAFERVAKGGQSARHPLGHPGRATAPTPSARSTR